MPIQVWLALPESHRTQKESQSHHFFPRLQYLLTHHARAEHIVCLSPNVCADQQQLHSEVWEGRSWIGIYVHKYVRLS